MLDEAVLGVDEKEPQTAVVEDDNSTETVEDTTEKTEELNPYKKQMADLAIENRQKAGALKEERKKAKELEERLAKSEESKAEEAEETEEKPKRKYLSPEEADALMDEKMRKARLEDKLSQITKDADEQKLIRFHLEHSIKRSGDVDNDLSMAIAIANKHLVEQAKKAESDRNDNEALNARFSGGGTYSKQGSSPVLSDPVKRQANEILKRLGIQDGEKYL